MKRELTTFLLLCTEDEEIQAHFGEGTPATITFWFEEYGTLYESACHPCGGPANPRIVPILGRVLPKQALQFPPTPPVRLADWSAEPREPCKVPGFLFCRQNNLPLHEKSQTGRTSWDDKMSFICASTVATGHIRLLIKVWLEWLRNWISNFT